MVPAPAPCAIPSASESKTGAFGRRYETCLGSKKASLPDQSCQFRPFTKKTSGLRVPLKFKGFRLNPWPGFQLCSWHTPSMMIGNTIHTENMSDNTIVGSESISFHLTLLLGSVTREWLIWETSSPAVFSRSNFVPFNSTIAVTITLTILIKGTWSTFERSKLFIRQCRSLKPIFNKEFTQSWFKKDLPWQLNRQKASFFRNLTSLLIRFRWIKTFRITHSKCRQYDIWKFIWLGPGVERNQWLYNNLTCISWVSGTIHSRNCSIFTYILWSRTNFSKIWICIFILHLGRTLFVNRGMRTQSVPQKISFLNFICLCNRRYYL